MLTNLQDPLGCIRSILVLTTAYPGVLSVKNASTLLPYLRSTGTVSIFCFITSLSAAANQSYE